MLRARAWLPLALWFAVQSSALGALEGAPTLRLDEGRLRLASLPALLDRAEVREALASGLTTSFVFEVTARDGGGGKVTGGSLVEMRYDLWDEVYYVAVITADGSQPAATRGRATLASRDQLLEWWRTLDLAVADAGPLAPGGAWQARVRLSVLPFSSAEQRDAQRWFSRSLEGEAGSAETSDVLNLLIATSIARESAVSFDWRLTVAAGRGGRGGR